MTGQQLKNSILQMAVQGKLVPQDPNDEPASVLVDRIREEKERLIAEGEIKKEKNPSRIFRGADNLPYEQIGKNKPVCIADEVPFDIPDSWEWIRLGEIITLTSGQDLTPDKYNSNRSGIPYITGASNIENDEVIINRWTEYPKAIAYNGDLLLTCKGTVGTMAFLKTEKVHIARQIMGISSPFGISLNYIRLFLDSYVASLKTAAKSMIPGIARADVLSILLPLPPKEEQLRVIEKCNELVQPIKEYDEAEKRVSNLNATFPVQLNKSILQWAVQGKLVPQDPFDESASVLLERIREEKARLVKEGRIKKDKNESIIIRRDNSHYEILNGEERCIDDEIPFDIPDSWSWCRLGELVETNIGLTYKPADKTDSSGTLVLRSSNIQNGQMDYTDCVYVSCQIPAKSRIEKGDILICARNGSRALVGKCAIVDVDGMAFGAFMAKIKSKFNPYIKLFLDSPVFRNQLDGVKTETINQITQEVLKKQLIPLPPILEQERIVKEVEKTVSLISTLE